MSADFLNAAIRANCVAASPRVLDFGCGAGELVRGLCALGLDAFGCDLASDVVAPAPGWKRAPPATGWGTRDRLSAIQLSPYRLPYPDNHFDAVVSTTVMEHVQNKEVVFREIQRVLRPGGRAYHLFPSKWYLPAEPHIFVPLASWLWPNIPRWWLATWAILGVRNATQRGWGWRKVYESNVAYCKTGLNYGSRRDYEALVESTGGSSGWLDRFYVSQMGGGTARLLRKLRFIPPTWGVYFRDWVLTVEKPAVGGLGDSTSGLEVRQELGRLAG